MSYYFIIKKKLLYFFLGCLFNFCTSYFLFASTSPVAASIEKILDNPSKDSFFIAAELRVYLDKKISLKQANEVVVSYRKKDPRQPWKNLIPIEFIESSEKTSASSSDSEFSSPNLDAHSAKSTESLFSAAAADDEPASSLNAELLPYGPHLKNARTEKNYEWLLRSKVRQFKYQKKAERDYNNISPIPEEIAKSTDLYFSETQRAFPSGSRLNAENITKWLKQEKLVNSALFDKGCLEVKEIKKRDLPGQLFQVFYRPSCLTNYKIQKLKQQKTFYGGPNKLLFIVKELSMTKGKEEIINLGKVQQAPEVRKLESIRNPRWPQFTFAEEFYRYKDLTGGQRLIILLLPAKGTGIYSLMRADFPSAYAAMKKLGETLATFHRKFMTHKECLLNDGTDLKACKTIVHGDLNLYNVFYDGTFIYFIDLETMADSLTTRRLFSLDCGDIISFLDTRTQESKETINQLKSIFLRSYTETLSQDPSVQYQIKDLIEEAAKKSPYSLIFS